MSGHEDAQTGGLIGARETGDTTRAEAIDAKLARRLQAIPRDQYLHKLHLATPYLIPGSRRPQQHHDGRPDAAGDGAADRGTGR